MLYGGSVRERHAGSNLSWQRAAARLMEHILQPRHCRALDPEDVSTRLHGHATHLRGF
jgi:hypothetical protein